MQYEELKPDHPAGGAAEKVEIKQGAQTEAYQHVKAHFAPVAPQQRKKNHGRGCQPKQGVANAGAKFFQPEGPPDHAVIIKAEARGRPNTYGDQKSPRLKIKRFQSDTPRVKKSALPRLVSG